MVEAKERVEISPELGWVAGQVEPDLVVPLQATKLAPDLASEVATPTGEVLLPACRERRIWKLAASRGDGRQPHRRRVRHSAQPAGPGIDVIEHHRAPARDVAPETGPECRCHLNLSVAVAGKRVQVIGEVRARESQ
jgi:hypothetical protein